MLTRYLFDCLIPGGFTVSIAQASLLALLAGIALFWKFFQEPYPRLAISGAQWFNGPVLRATTGYKLRTGAGRAQPVQPAQLSAQINPLEYTSGGCEDGVSPDAIQRGFQLAFFLVPNRQAALEILASAMMKHHEQWNREQKRNYWRDKKLKRSIRRIARDRLDTLQWLICFEAEEHEKRHEETSGPSVEDLVVRYIKTLVQSTTVRSSMYVAVGVQRLLYGYSTPETQKAYEWLTNSYPGDEKYRRVKAAIMDELETRFHVFLRTFTKPNGERKFEISDGQSQWAGLVDRSLQLLIPWSTLRPCSQTDNLAAALSSDGGRSADPDRVEIRRCHVFIDPTCFSDLVRTLGLEDPGTRLALPAFFLNSSGNGGNPGSSREAHELTDVERKGLLSGIAGSEAERRRTSPRLIKIFADRKLCAQCELSLSAPAKVECRIYEGVHLIEIYTQAEDRDVFLTSHFVAYTHEDKLAEDAISLCVGKDLELRLKILPFASEGDAPGLATLLLDCRRSSLFARLRERLALPALTLWRSVLPKVALAMGLLALGWVLARVHYRLEVERAKESLASERTSVAALQKRLDASRPAPEVDVYRLTPNDWGAGKVRGAGGPSEPTVPISEHSSVITLELQAGKAKDAFSVDLKPLLEGQEILRARNLPVTSTDTGNVIQLTVPVSILRPGEYYVVHAKSVGKPYRTLEFEFKVMRR